MKKLLLGDEAIAQGAIDAGLSGVYAYPGTPSTEITEYIQGYCRKNPSEKLHSRWCTNEKTAMEAALGMSFAGKRALVCMKRFLYCPVLTIMSLGVPYWIHLPALLNLYVLLPIFSVPVAI